MQRACVSIRHPDYEKFTLPFCSRCPRVIIESLCDIISEAKIRGKLRERVDKEYICYLPKKLSDSEKYPKIVHAHCSVQKKNTPYIAKFIEQEIDKLKGDEIVKANVESDFTVLITGPKRYLKQINSYLKKRKEYIMSFRKLEPEARSVAIIEGYKLLLEKDKFSNLGWRILLECDPVNDFRCLIEKTLKDIRTRIYDFLPNAFKERHEANLMIAEKLVKNEEITQKQRKTLEDLFGVKAELLKAELIEDDEKKGRRK